MKAWWDHAFERSGNIWNCRQVAECWEATFAERRSFVPWICWAKHESGGRILYPLYARRDRRFGGRRWLIEPIGGLELCDYQDPLTSEDLSPRLKGSYWSALAAAVRKRFGILSELRAYRVLNPPPSTASRHVSPVDVAPRILLEGCGGIEEFLSTGSPKLRKYVLRRLRQLRDEPAISVRRIAGTELEPSLERFFHRYAAQWARGRKAHALQDPAIRDWWSGLARAALDAGKLHFSVLERGQDDWHWHLGFLHRGSLLWYKLAYNIAFESYSPGLLHLALLIDRAAQEGISMIDLGSGSEDYKFRWSRETATLFKVEAGISSSASRLVRGLRTALGRQL